MKTIVIDRSKWFRGMGHERSRLKIKGEEMYCCVGFYMLQAGVPKEALENVPTAADPMGGVEGRWLCDAFNQDSTRVYNINDAKHVTDEERDDAW